MNNSKLIKNKTMEENSRHSIIIQRISDMEATVESVTTGFYKFLARFSGMKLT